MKRAKILVADDDRGMRSMLRVRLGEWGYLVVESSNGLDAWGTAVRENVDAMILDHLMPQGDGRSVARVIRRECAALIVFLSGCRVELFEEIVRQWPDVYFLPKPLDSQALHDLLQSLCVNRLRSRGFIAAH